MAKIYDDAQKLLKQLKKDEKNTMAHVQKMSGEACDFDQQMLTAIEADTKNFSNHVGNLKNKLAAMATTVQAVDK